MIKLPLKKNVLVNVHANTNSIKYAFTILKYFDKAGFSPALPFSSKLRKNGIKGVVSILNC